MAGTWAHYWVPKLGASPLRIGFSWLSTFGDFMFGLLLIGEVPLAAVGGYLTATWLATVCGIRVSPYPLVVPTNKVSQRHFLRSHPWSIIYEKNNLIRAGHL